MEEMSFEELQQIVSICLDEIIELKSKNDELTKSMKSLQESMSEMVLGEKKIIQNVKDLDSNAAMHMNLLANSIQNLKYEYLDPRACHDLVKYPMFYDIDETVEMIVNKRCSLARYGDGEFSIMSGIERQKFQRVDEKLSLRLQEVINVIEEGFLVGIADNYGSLEKYNKGGKQGIRWYMTDEVRKEHWRFLDEKRKYHNAYLSRPYALYADNMTDAPKKRFENLKRIWNDREVIFVEGALTRLGVGNDLFDNAKSIRRIVVPPVSAFDKYDEILQASLRYASKDVLFLLAIGPAAGVLAYDIYKNGFQAVDIGHVDLEYEWFLQGKGSRCEVKHKYNNELTGGDLVEDIHDENYLREILCVIGE